MEPRGPGSQRRQEASSLQLGPAHTQVLAIYPPEQRENSFLLCEPPVRGPTLRQPQDTHRCCAGQHSVLGGSAMALNPACVPGDTSRSVTGARMTHSDLLTLPASGEAHTMGRRCLTWTRGTGRCPGNQVQVEGVASSITQQVPRGHTGHSQRDRQAQPPAAGAGVPGRGGQQ